MTDTSFRALVFRQLRQGPSQTDRRIRRGASPAATPRRRTLETCATRRLPPLPRLRSARSRSKPSAPEPQPPPPLPHTGTLWEPRQVDSPRATDSTDATHRPAAATGHRTDHEDQQAQRTDTRQRLASKIERDDLDDVKIGDLRQHLRAVGSELRIEYVLGERHYRMT